MSPFQLAQHHGTTSCHRKYLLLSGLPLAGTSCYRDYLLLSETLLDIKTTSCYRKHLLLLRLPLVIGNTSCYRDLPLVVGNTSCFQKAFLSDSELHTIRPNKTEAKIIAEKKFGIHLHRGWNLQLASVTITPTPNPLSYRHCSETDFGILLIIPNRYCRRNVRFPGYSSPHGTFQKCAARVLIRPGCTNAAPNQIQ